MKNEGGVICMHYSENSSIVQSSFFNSLARSSGGVIYLTVCETCSIFNNYFFDCSASGSGGVIYMSECPTCLIISSSFFNSSARGAGGVIYLSYSSNCSILSSSFFNSSTNTNGGALFLESMSHKISIFSTIFFRSQSFLLGGALYFSRNISDGLLFNCSFFSNFAFQGGDIFSEFGNINYTFRDSKFAESQSEFGTVLISDFFSEFRFLNCHFFNISYPSSVFRSGMGCALMLDSCEFKDISPLYSGNPIFLVIARDNILKLSDCLVGKITDYILVDNSRNFSIILLKTLLDFDSSFDYPELFSLKSHQLKLNFKNVKILTSHLKKDNLTIFGFVQKLLNLDLENLIFDSTLKILNLIICYYPKNINVNFTKIVYRNFTGSLLNVRSYSNSLSRIFINDCILPLKSTLTHFITIQNSAEIFIQNSTFVLAKEHSFAAIFFYGEYKDVLLNIRRSSFIANDKKNDFYLEENSDSLFGLIHASNGMSNFTIFQSSISLGLKNLISIFFIPNFRQIVVNSTNIFTNYLNQRSSLLIFSFCSSCLFYMENSRFENNRVAHGAFIFFDFSQGLENVTQLDSYFFQLGKNNVIRKNSASPQGGSFYFNASLFMGRNISQIIISLLRNFNLTKTSLYDFRKEVILYFEASHENLLNINSNLKNLKSKTANIFGKMLLRTIVTSFKLFDRSREIYYDYPLSPYIKMESEVFNNKTIKKILQVCFAFFDSFDQNIVLAGETDLNPLLNKRTIIPYIKLDFMFLYFQFYRGSHCAYKFFLEGEYTSKMGKEFNFSIDPAAMTKFIPTLNPNLSSSYIVSFRVHDCAEGELFKDNQCMPCPRETFLNEKVVGTLTKCNSCTDFDYFYCYGGNMRSPKPDFWRFSNYSSKFLKCTSTACLGDIYFFKNFTEIECLNCFLPGSNHDLLFYSFDQKINAIGFCKYGYTGNLCSSCIEGFGSTGSFKCTNCSFLKPYIMQAFMAVLNLILFYYSCWVSIKNNTLSLGVDRRTPEFVNNVISSYILNIFFMYLNVISVLKLLPFETSDFINDMVQYSSEVNPAEKAEIFSFGCLLKRIGVNLAPIYSDIVINFIFFGLSSIALIIMFLFQIRNNQKKIGKSLIISSLKGVFLIFLMNNLIRILGPSFRVLLCVNLGDNNFPNEYILSDVSLQCNTVIHNTFRFLISLPSILIFCISIPGALIYKLIKVKNPKDDKQFILTYGYFIHPFKNNAIYFQIIITLYKIILIFFKEIFLSLIITDNQASAPSILICFLLSYYFLHKIISPYNGKNYKILQNLSLMSLRTNISNSLVALFWILLRNQANKLFANLIIVFYLGSSNLLFLGVWIFHFLKSKRGEMFNKIQQWLKVLNKIPCFDAKNKLSILSSAESGFHKQRNNQSIQNLQNENLKLRILVKLLTKQLENQQKEKLISHKMHEYNNQNLTKINTFTINKRYFNESFKEKSEKEIIFRKSDLPVNKVYQSKGDIPPFEIEEEKDSDSFLNKNLPNFQVVPDKQDSADESKRKTNKTPPVLILSEKDLKLESRNLHGEEFNESFLKLKYLVEGNKIELSKNRIFLAIPSFIEADIVENKDWVASALMKVETSKLIKFTVFLKRTSRWLKPPFSQTLTIQLQLNLSKIIQMKVCVRMKDFIRLNSLKWDQESLKISSSENPLISDKLFDEKELKLLKLDFKHKNTISGTLNISSPFIEKQIQDFKLELSKEGILIIIGQKLFCGESILFGLLKEYFNHNY